MTFKKILLASLAIIATAATAQAGELVITHSGKVRADGTAPKFAMIRRLQSNIHSTRQLASAFPPTWVFSYTNGGSTFNETFIGTNPKTNSTTTTVPVYLVPVKLTYGTTSYDPTKVTANGVSIVQNVLNSPVFSKSIDYVQGGVDLGTTQYLDAYQRGNLWGAGASGTTYHVVLGTPTVTALQSLTVPTRNGKLISAFGASNLIMANINWFDPQIAAMISRLGIPSNALPLFITTQTYLSSSNSTTGCCIGGYHTVATSGQPYSHATYITKSGAFAQDVSALSHEIGEWIDDPNTNNTVPAACGASANLENGDPLENNANYGDYAYTVNGVTWNLQDLVFLPYFGAPASTSVNGWSTFQGETIAFCSAGG